MPHWKNTTGISTQSHFVEIVNNFPPFPYETVLEMRRRWYTYSDSVKKARLLSQVVANKTTSRTDLQVNNNSTEIPSKLFVAASQINGSNGEATGTDDLDNVPQSGFYDPDETPLVEFSSVSTPLGPPIEATPIRTLPPRLPDYIVLSLSVIVTGVIVYIVCTTFYVVLFYGTLFGIIYFLMTFLRFRVLSRLVSLVIVCISSIVALFGTVIFGCIICVAILILVYQTVLYLIYYSSKYQFRIKHTIYGWYTLWKAKIEGFITRHHAQVTGVDVVSEHEVASQINGSQGEATGTDDLAHRPRVSGSRFHQRPVNGGRHDEEHIPVPNRAVLIRRARQREDFAILRANAALVAARLAEDPALIPHRPLPQVIDNRHIRIPNYVQENCCVCYEPMTPPSNPRISSTVYYCIPCLHTMCTLCFLRMERVTPLDVPGCPICRAPQNVNPSFFHRNGHLVPANNWVVDPPGWDVDPPPNPAGDLPNQAQDFDYAVNPAPLNPGVEDPQDPPLAPVAYAEEDFLEFPLYFRPPNFSWYVVSYLCSILWCYSDIIVSVITTLLNWFMVYTGLDILYGEVVWEPVFPPPHPHLPDRDIQHLSIYSPIGTPGHLFLLHGYCYFQLARVYGPALTGPVYRSRCSNLLNDDLPRFIESDLAREYPALTPLELSNTAIALYQSILLVNYRRTQGTYLVNRRGRDVNY
jgi:hypothetical protein